jgi:hypothetical protein
MKRLACKMSFAFLVMAAKDDGLVLVAARFVR